jgi:hypothetical protein
MYFRFVAQSSRSQTINSGAMDFRTRPEAAIRKIENPAKINPPKRVY